jgi:acyl-coenzyme A synthetase/AMP-(fatty) acid ligase
VVIYTSGSTASRRALHARHLVRHSFNVGQYQDFVPGDRVYASMPFFWVGGLVTALLTCMYRGATLLCEEGFDPDRTLAFLSRERATVIGAWPAMIQALAQHPRLRGRLLVRARRKPLRVMPPSAPRISSCPNSLGVTETCGPHTGAT